MSTNAPSSNQQQRSTSRMTLANVHKAVAKGGLRIFLYSLEKLGKTTFAAQAPSPIFIAPENGFPKGVAPPVFPMPQTWREVGEAVGVLINEPHEYATLIVDTIDWLAPLLYREVCAEANQGKNDKNVIKSIDDFDFGEGYTRAATKLRTMIGWLETLRVRRNMNIIILAHAEITTFKNPTGPDYDKYQPKMNKKLVAIIKEWSDCLLFGNYKATNVKTRRKAGDDRALLDKGKVINHHANAGVRVIHTTHTPYWDAGNRCNLPVEIPFDWNHFSSLVNLTTAESNAKAEELQKQCSVYILQIKRDESRAAATKYLQECGNDLGRLSTCLNRVKATVIEQAEAEAEEAAGYEGDEPPTGAAPEGASADGAPTGNDEPPSTEPKQTYRDETDEDPEWIAGEPAPADDLDDQARTPREHQRPQMEPTGQRQAAQSAKATDGPATQQPRLSLDSPPSNAPPARAPSRSRRPATAAA